MSANTEYVIKKDMDFHGIPYTTLFCGFELLTGKPRSIYKTDEYEVLSEAEFNKKVEAFCVAFCGNWKETTEQRYNDMLDILPPLKWELGTRGGFFISEAYTLDIHPFHQKYNGRFYEAYFRINTPRDEILQSLAKFVKAQEKEVA